MEKNNMGFKSKLNNGLKHFLKLNPTNNKFYNNKFINMLVEQLDINELELYYKLCLLSENKQHEIYNVLKKTNWKTLDIDQSDKLQQYFNTFQKTISIKDVIDVEIENNNKRNMYRVSKIYNPGGMIVGFKERKTKNYSEIKIQHYDYLKHLYKKRHIPLTLPPIEKISDYKICKIADYINYKCNK